MGQRNTEKGKQEKCKDNSKFQRFDLALDSYIRLQKARIYLCPVIIVYVIVGIF